MTRSISLFKTCLPIGKRAAFSALILLGGKALFGQAITGTVYLDLNANGMKDATEVGFAGVSVTAYNAAGTAFGPVTTSASGSYTTAALAAGNYRIEFTSLPAGYFNGPKGTASGTTVQFAAAGAANVNLGIAHPTDYCQNNPPLALPCYEGGAGTTAGWTTASTHPGIAAFPATATGTQASPMQPMPTKNVAIGSIGSTWGAAWKKDASRMFFSAVLKRHVDLGEFARPSAAGVETVDGIYMVDYSGLTGTYKGGFRLQGVAGIDLGTVSRSHTSAAISATAAADDNKLSTSNRQSRDLSAFSKIGKVGIGDIHLSEDYKYLWAVNLNQSSLIRVDVSNTAALPTTGGTVSAALVSTFPIDFSPLGAQAGAFRPWAITMWHGRGYVGVVNDALGGTAAQLKAFVLSFDPASVAGSWVKEFEMSLDFNRENSAWPTSQNAALRNGKWRPWIDTWTQTTLTQEFSYPQPLLSNIEFNNDGSMVLGFLDRGGMQFDYNQLTPISAKNLLLSVDAAGDIVYVCKTGGVFKVEGDAGCLIDTDPGTPSPGSATDGPKNVGEYFYQEHSLVGTTAHMEESFGALAMLNGAQQVVTSAFDVITEQFNQGVHFYSTSTGKRTSQYQITANNTNKGVGLGEPEPMCAVPPIQIGNFVWKDTDADGVQDAGEPALVGVTVKLYAADGTTLIATAVTDAAGQYYFSNAAGSSTASNILSLSLSPSTNYQLKISALGSDASVTGLALTGVTTGGTSGTNAGTSISNNDATVVAGLPTILLKTGFYGENNHTYDFGFTGCTATATASSSPATACAGATVNLTVTGGAAGATYQWTGPGGFTSTAQNPAIAGVTQSQAGTYSVTVTNGPGCSATGTTSFLVNTVEPTAASSAGCVGEAISLTATGGGTYSWSGPNGFSSTNQNPQIMASTAGDAGVYTVQVTKNGCTAAANTTVVMSTGMPGIEANDPVCAGGTLMLSATGGGTTYSWTGPNGFTSTLQSPSISNVTAAAAGTYNVTISGGGCGGMTSATVAINSNPVATVTKGAICEGEALQLHATGGTSYAWSGPNGFSSTSSDPVINPAVSANTGSYSVTITNPMSFCSASVSASVFGGTITLTNYAEIISADNVVSNATLANNSTAENDDALASSELITCTKPTFSLAATSPTCSGPVANSDGTITVSSITNGDHIGWSIGTTYSGPSFDNSTAFSGGTYSITGLPNPAAPTVYTVRVFNAGQCCVKDFTVNIDPAACAAASNNGPICAGSDLQLTASGGISYSWSGPGGFTSTAQNPVRSPGVGGTYTVTVTSGANTSIASTTAVVSSPTATATSNSPVAAGQPINLSASGGVGYNWSGPGGFTATTADATIPSAAAGNSGTYTVTVTDANGCTAVASVAVSVVTPPGGCTMTATAGSNGPICEGSTLNLTASTSSPAISYLWSGPSGFSSTQQNPTIEGATNQHQTGTYSVTATAANGCTAVSTKAVVVDTMPPVPGITGTTLTSVGGAITLTAAGPATGNYLWTLPNASTMTGQTINIPSASVAAHNGTFTVALINGTCQSTASIAVAVKENTHLVVSKVADKSTVTAGSLETVVFTIQLTNQGGTAATNVLVKDKLPSGLNFVSSSPSVGSYDAVTGIWTIPSAASGNSTLTITATVQ